MKFLLLFCLFINNIYSEFNLAEDQDSNIITKPTISFEIQKYSIPENLKGEELFEYLHKITEQKIILTYKEAKQKIFYEIDNITCPSGKNGVWAFYSNICVEGKYDSGEKYVEYLDLNLDGYIDLNGMNIEHIWPQSYFNRKYPMLSDLNHLRPTFITPNNKRANLPFYYVTNPIYTIGTSDARLGKEYFEPPHNKKGDTARVLFYFVVRYYDKSILNSSVSYDKFFISKIKTYMLWNRIDPPDDNERKRNDLVYKFQGNRNPFIDDPKLIEKIDETIWASKIPKITP